MRLKIIAGYFLSTLILGLASFYVVKSQLKNTLATDIDQSVSSQYRQLGRAWKLSALEFVEQVRDRASTDTLVGTFSALDENARRQRAFEAAQSTANWFQDPLRGQNGRPDLVVITDATGKVLARDTDPNRMFGVALATSLPSLRSVLQNGNEVHDAWHIEDENKILRVAISAIRNPDGTILGALIVGYDVSNTLATEEARILGHDVAFLSEGRVYAFSRPLQGAAVADLRGQITSTFKNELDRALRGNTSSALKVTLDQNDYVVIMAPLEMMSSVPMAYAVLANRTDAQSPADIAQYILLLAAVTLLMGVVYGYYISNTILEPLEDIEDGVLSVINGRHDLRLETEGELGGLAYRINQLINVFTGVSESEETSSSEQAGEQWGSEFDQNAGQTGQAVASQVVSGGDSSQPIDDPAISASLAAEPEDLYHQRIFKEYMAAKRSVGEDISNIPQDRFVQRLKGQAQSLAKRHDVSQVRFQVEVAGHQVVLRPVLIRT